MNRDIVLLYVFFAVWAALAVVTITIIIVDTQFIPRCIDHNKYADLSYNDKAAQCIQAYEIFRYKEKN